MWCALHPAWSRAWQFLWAAVMSARLDEGGACVSFVFRLGLPKKVKFKQPVNLRKSKHRGVSSCPSCQRGEEQGGLSHQILTSPFLHIFRLFPSFFANTHFLFGNKRNPSCPEAGDFHFYLLKLMMVSKDT